MADEIHAIFQKVCWALALVFALIRGSHAKFAFEEFSVMLVITIELSLLAWFLRYSAHYFEGDRKAREHWVVPSIVLFLFFTFPFAVSLAVSKL